MKTLLVAFLITLMPLTGMASGSAVHLDEANIDPSDKASLQRGAKYFINYCMGCHSVKYQRYSRMASDLGLSDAQVEDNLIFTTDEDGAPSKVGSLMTINMSDKYAKAAFGVVPPDLSLVARSRSPDWIYTYLRSFYLDDSRPMGVNNSLFKNVGMPHVLWELQGLQTARYEAHEEGAEKHISHLELTQKGSLNEAEYNTVVRDLVNFLAYVAEPTKQKRESMGIWVILFLMFFTFIAYQLKKEYWKDIH
ncbi:MAG: cytochrome c1 [Gammaproteobacteria bacterium]|nr:cytochrome c1 [Gammaproteobacteria bacterium]